jgi:ribonuclease R
MLSHDGHVISSKFYPAVIRSKRRFTYKEVLTCIERKPADDIERMVHQAHQLAQRIRKHRFTAGSLDLDFPESKIRLDDEGRVSRIERIENDESHQLIEEFMLLANEAVAAHLMSQNKPAVYRIHEAPKAKRLEDYRDEVLSHQVPCGNLTVRSDVQKLLSLLGTIPLGGALKIGFLKSLMRARYDTAPLGHYGLSKPKYTHFTSPIRRYADLVVHRALFDPKHACNTGMKQIAEHITNTERNSSDAERSSKEVKMFAYLKAQLTSRKPVPYRATVTDVRNSVFFVEVIDLGMSCAVPVSSLKGEKFYFDAQRRLLFGQRSGYSIRLGDEVTVQIRRIDEEKKQADFELVPPEKPAKREITRSTHSKPAKKSPAPPAPQRRPVKRGVHPPEGRWAKAARTV